jgi:membrane-bound ClpP family serine protease
MTWILLLFALALALFFLEVFIPGGILFLVGIVLMLVASVVAWTQYGGGAALIAFLVGLALAVGMLLLELYILPRTKFGRRLFLGDQIEGGSLQAAGAPELVGQEAETATSLSPSGRIVFDGRLHEAISRSGYLPKGTPVRILSVDAFHVVVEKR